MTSKRDTSCFVLALVPDASASTRLPWLAYINVPLSTYCRYRNSRRHRAVLPTIGRLSWCQLRHASSYYWTVCILYFEWPFRLRIYVIRLHFYWEGDVRDSEVIGFCVVINFPLKYPARSHAWLESCIYKLTAGQCMDVLMTMHC